MPEPGSHARTATYLFSDLEGSTELLQRLGPEAYGATLSSYRQILREVAEPDGGEVVDEEGDGIFLAFPTASGAVRAAAGAQQRLLSREDQAPLRARMGLHTGEALRHDQGLVSLEVHRAARVGAAAWGGQVLLTHRTWELARDAVGGEDLGTVDLGEHRLKDLSEPVHLVQLVGPDLPEDLPPPRTLSPERNNLPIQLTSFVGREEELARVAALLGGSRLVTLTGVGGSGKTRLALHASAAAVDEHPDGVWLVELAGLTDPERVADEVAKALGVREGEGGGVMFAGRGTRPTRRRLVEYLRHKELVLLLDNCEHLLEAAGSLADLLLRSCPGVRILATSREGLGIAGESLFQVPSLGLPDPDSPEGEDADALRLFAERARAVAPSFSLTAETRPHVVRVCRRLDGIPLAIELAAARVKVLGVDRLAARLDDRFRLLTGGSRTALPRQQTLEATVDWSYQLLTVEEQALLRRLSVFAGGFTLDAAETICSGGVVAEADVLELLSHLVDKSMVATVEGPAGPARYRLLETLRAYARDKFNATEDVEGTRRGHRDWFLALAQEAAQHLEGPEQRTWLERLDTEHDNLRAALEWSLGTDDGQAAATLACSLTWYWVKHGHASEGREHVRRILEESGALTVAHRAKLHLATGTLAWSQGDSEAAITSLEESFDLAGEIGDRHTEAQCQTLLGSALIDPGELDRAEALLNDALGTWRELGVLPRVAQCLAHLGGVARFRGEFGLARSLYEEAHEVAARSRDTWSRAWAANFAGIAARYQGDLEAARGLHRDALELFEDLGVRQGTAFSMSCLGILARLQGDYDRAVELHQQAVGIERELGVGTAESEMFLGELARLRGDLDRAGRLLRSALDSHREEGSLRATLLALGRIAGWEQEAGDPERAARLLGATEHLLEEHGLEIPPPELPFHRADAAAVQDELGAERFEELVVEGQAMTLDEALAYAIGSTTVDS